MTFIKGQSGNPKGNPKDWQENSEKMIRKMALQNDKKANLVLALGDGKTLREAAEIAGYASAQSAWNALKSIRKDAPMILDMMNLSLPRAFRKLGDQLEAKETKFFQEKGIVTDQRDVQAHEIQQNAAIQIARLHNAYPSRSEEGNAGTQVLNKITVIIEDVSRDVSRPGARTITAEATPAQ